MSKLTLETHFAPADRTDEEDIASQHRKLEAQKNVVQLINAIPDLVAILDENRQVVVANMALINLLGGGDVDKVLGLRPGEAVQCHHASEMEAGCGTSEACSTCGAVRAILSSQKGKTDVQECQIAQLGGGALDLRVTASPIEFNNRRYTILSVHNIADEKRRHVLERTFFHDILNSAGGIQGIANVLVECTSADELEEFVPMLGKSASRLVDEIKAQRDLLAAERDDLEIGCELLHSGEILQDVAGLYQNHPVSKNRSIEIDSEAADTYLNSSRPLLLRTLGNMLKNALEASGEGEKVRLGCRATETDIEFWVWNPTPIPRDVQLQLFNRSFSTKGSGRGIGTYSMKLLAERYLGGKVRFESNEDEGTTFYASLPLNIPDA
jgi:signal transduction histidine kinase